MSIISPISHVILRHYSISEETYREQLRSVKREEESHREMATQVMDLTNKWTKGCGSVQDVVQLVATEQLINSMADEVRVWVRERKPGTCMEAGELADDYERAKKNMKVESARKGGKGLTPSQLKCFSRGMVRHHMAECPAERRT